MFQFSSCTRFDEFPNGGLRVVLPGKKCIDYVDISVQTTNDFPKSYTPGSKNRLPKVVSQVEGNHRKPQDHPRPQVFGRNI